VQRRRRFYNKIKLMHKIVNQGIRTPEDVAAFLELLEAKGEPDKLRKKLLSRICEITGASAACLILDGEPEGKFRFGRITERDYEKAVEEISNASRSVLHRKNICLLKIKSGDTSLGYLALHYKVTNSNKPSNLLRSIATIVSIFEYQQRLLKLLKISQKSLRNFAAQSRSIAENNQRLFEQLTTNIDRLQGMSKGVIRMQEAERSKISRELHDGIGQSLTALKMNLDFVFADLRKNTSAESKHQLEDARKLAEQSLAEVRELSRLLRPRMLDDLGLVPTLQWLARTFTKRTGIKVILQTNGSQPEVDSEIETMLFRITQEALNNVAKHSGSKVARVKLDCLRSSIRLSVEDKGKGFNTADTAKVKDQEFGSGLSGIRDRVTLWTGKFTVESVAGRGTSLHVEIPIPDRDK
jgi:two-component system sensor histidine kinase UhpB